MGRREEGERYVGWLDKWMMEPVTRRTNISIKQNTYDVVKIRPKTLNPSCPHQSGSFRPQLPLPCFTVSVPVTKPHAQPHRLCTPRPPPSITARNKLLGMHQQAVQMSPPLRSLLNATASNNASSQRPLTTLLASPPGLLPLFAQSHTLWV